MIKYVVYDLKWHGEHNEIGDQPYKTVAESAAIFDGGVYLKNGEYFGYITGDEDKCLKAIESCKDIFKMVEITQNKALELYEKAIPVNTELTNGTTKYYGKPYIGKDDKIYQDLFDEPQ